MLPTHHSQSLACCRTSSQDTLTQPSVMSSMNDQQLLAFDITMPQPTVNQLYVASRGMLQVQQTILESLKIIQQITSVKYGKPDDITMPMS